MNVFHASMRDRRTDLDVSQVELKCYFIKWNIKKESAQQFKGLRPFTPAEVWQSCC